MALLPHELQLRVLLLLDSDKPSIAALLRVCKGREHRRRHHAGASALVPWPGCPPQPHRHQCVGHQWRSPRGLQALPRLKKLRLQSYYAEELPAGLWALTRVSKLELLYDSLQALPDSITQLAALTLLKLVSCNQLQVLPDSIGSLAGCRS
jgi:Leucine-rich repeat (LRR) protein